MTINELIEFCNENFDEKQRKNMHVYLVGENNDWREEPPEPIDLFNVKAGIRGVEIHI